MSTVTFTTSISRYSERFDSPNMAHAAARCWIASLLTPGAKRAGEKSRKLDKNTYSIRHIAGATVAVAKVS